MAVQETLDGVETVEKDLPFQTVSFNQAEYKLFGIVTNRTIPGNELINWHRARCGDSEKVHSMQKGDLAGNQFPSDQFGANAAWWHMMVMSFNLNALMKKLALPVPLKSKRMKSLRLDVIGLAGKVVQHTRGLFIKLGGGETVLARLNEIRLNIANLGQPPPTTRAI